MQYVHWLLIVSAAFVALERLFPWRREQRLLRVGWLRDLAFLLFNGWAYSVLFGGLSAWLATRTDDALGGVHREVRAVADWPLWAQFLAFFVLADLIQWCVHNLLHRVPFLWTFHKVHHSVHEMDWIANFRFHWLENVVYACAQYVPLAALGASYEAIFWVYVAGTAWGHFNHSNLNCSLGPLGYVFNSPRMHLWHHDASTEGAPAKNFAIVLSLWDWLFGTAYWPRARDPERIGYPGDAEMPQHFGGEMLWPLRLR